ncbi:MAG TPA: sigma-70 family RNA polymerase sigma factor [Candidatus Limnocylindrales bacterium]|nr:sigma-70 family RNA polymerase sigma factor [Candidatus Limnocylindrales bacterium]
MTDTGREARSASPEFRVDPGRVERGAVPDAGVAHPDAQHLFGFVRRLGLSDDQADDAVQEVLTRLLEQARRGVVVENERAWAFRAIYRIAMDQHRFRRRVAGFLASLDPRGGHDAAADTADRVAVWAEVDRLPERQRAVVYLRYRADLRFEEIADALGITPSAARSHSTQAMATLRARFATSGEPR